MSRVKLKDLEKLLGRIFLTAIFSALLAEIVISKSLSIVEFPILSLAFITSYVVIILAYIGIKAEKDEIEIKHFTLLLWIGLCVFLSMAVIAGVLNLMKTSVRDAYTLIVGCLVLTLLTLYSGKWNNAKGNYKNS
jgi:L-asparagine transporter-like permease